uniref:Uncharacterized protein n=1 Tax=Tanacetum cinerariifolium TaxID=118510 RepID=A0A699HQY0_TANCI|nr:hypothetical protein [Tanacetum cinerariifolium]
MDLKEGLGGGGFVVLGEVRSVWMVELVPVEARSKEVVDFGVVKSLQGEIPRYVMGESGGETFGVDGEPFGSRLEGIVVDREEMWDADSQSNMLGR